MAENGLVAKTIFDATEKAFDLILSDIRMPELDGIQLLLHCKHHRKDSKFLIFTGFSEYLETHSAAELGADAFLAKPFRLAELVKQVGQLLFPEASAATEIEKENEEQRYCRVAVEDFFSTTRLSSDIFIKIGTSKFIRLAKEGAEIDISRLQHFKENKVAFLFVRNEDFHKYTGLNLKIAGAIAKSDKFSDEKKARIFKHTSEMLLQQVFVGKIEKAVCDNAYAMLDNTVKAVSENEDLFEMLMMLQSRGDKLYAHCMVVSVYACMIATKIGWTSAANQYKISLAGLFHDIGFKELPEGLHDKPRFKMTADEIKLYESHPTRGKEILLSISGYPNDLATVVGQHHENAAGTGYPQRMSSLKAHPIGQLIHFADELAGRINSAQVTSVDGAGAILIDLFETRREEFDTEILCGAFDLFHVERPKGLKNRVA
jgi:putative nucleotidyltransferase with HDIG domain